MTNRTRMVVVVGCIGAAVAMVVVGAVVVLTMMGRSRTSGGVERQTFLEERSYPKDPAEVTDLDYITLKKDAAMWDECGLSVPSRMLLIGGYRPGDTGPGDTKERIEATCTKEGAFYRTCLSAAEDEAFRRLFVSAGLHHVRVPVPMVGRVVDARDRNTLGPWIVYQLDVAPYKPEPDYSAFLKTHTKFPSPWLSSEDWKRENYPTPLTIVHSVKDLVPVEASKNAWVRKQAYEWLMRSKPNAGDRSVALGMLRPYLFPVGKPQKRAEGEGIGADYQERLAEVYCRWVSAGEAADLQTLVGKGNPALDVRQKAFAALVRECPEVATQMYRTGAKPGAEWQEMRVYGQAADWRRSAEPALAEFGYRETAIARGAKEAEARALGQRMAARRAAERAARVKLGREKGKDDEFIQSFPKTPEEILTAIETADFEWRNAGLGQVATAKWPAELEARLHAAVWYALEEEEEATRGNALKALMAVARPDEIGRLKAFAEAKPVSGDIGHLNAVAVLAIARVDPGQGIPMLERLYGPRGGRVPQLHDWWAGVPELCEPVVITMVGSKVRDLRVESIRYLEQYGGTRCLAALEKVKSGDADAELRRAAEAAIVRVKQNVKGRDEEKKRNDEWNRAEAERRKGG